MCISPNRIYVHSSVHDKFVKKVSEKMDKEIKLGSGLDEDTTLGPLMNINQLKRVSRITFRVKIKHLYRKV